MLLKIVPFKKMIIAGLVVLLHTGLPYSQSKVITIGDAVTVSISNFSEIKYQQIEIDKAEGRLKQARLFPNPYLSIYNERLESGSVNAGESIVSIDQPLNFLWTRSSLIEMSAQSLIEQQLLYENKLRLFEYTVKRAYILYHTAEKNHKTLQSIAGIFEKLDKAGEDRLKDGDISVYGKKRISIEYLKYLKSMKESKIDVSSKESMINYLMGHSVEETIQTTAPTVKTIPAINLQSMIESSYAYRPDLKALDAGFKSEQAGLNYIRKTALPNVNILAGYKKQVNGFNGRVVQLNINLPIFNRNQGARFSAEAGLKQRALLTDQLKLKIRLEVENAATKYKELRELSDKYSDTTDQFFESLLSTAQISYTEGEMTLVEFMDAINAYTGSHFSRNELVQDLYLSIYELEMVTGIKFD